MAEIKFRKELYNADMLKKICIEGYIEHVPNDQIEQYTKLPHKENIAVKLDGKYHLLTGALNDIGVTSLRVVSKVLLKKCKVVPAPRVREMTFQEKWNIQHQALQRN